MAEGLSAAALILSAAKGGGGTGTTNYNNLSNKPKINDVELTGNKSLEDLGIETPDVDKAYVDEEIARVEAEIPEVPTNVSAFTNDAGYLTSHQDISNLATKTELTAETTAREASETALTNAINTKQDELTAGTNITIVDNVISATGGSGSGYEPDMGTIVLNSDNELSVPIDNNTIRLNQGHLQAIANVNVDGNTVDKDVFGDLKTTLGGKVVKAIQFAGFSRGTRSVEANVPYNMNTAGDWNRLNLTEQDTRLQCDVNLNGGWGHKDKYFRFNFDSETNKYVATPFGWVRFEVDLENHNATMIIIQSDAQEIRHLTLENNLYNWDITPIDAYAIPIDNSTITVNQQGQLQSSGSEPAAYIKSASVSDNTLTLVNKDNTTVEFTPQGGTEVSGTNDGTNWTSLTIDDDTYAIPSGGGSSYTFTNGLTESSGTVSWDLNDKIQAGTGNKSVKIGKLSPISVASGEGSICIGQDDNDSSAHKATKQGSIAIGRAQQSGTIESSGAGSIAIGYCYGIARSLKASGGGSIVLGGCFQHDIQATGFGAMALGFAQTANTISSGEESIAIGDGITANAANQIVMGKCNVADNTKIFIIGNGTSDSSRNNALTLDNSGNLVCNNIPAPPTTDGEYDLHCSIVGGVVTYS